MKIALKVKMKNGYLQQFIDSKGWTQSDFARAIECSIGTVGKWFNMETYPTDISMLRVCELLDMEPERIFPQILNEKSFKQVHKSRLIFKDVNDEELIFISDVPQKLLVDTSGSDNFELKETLDTVLGTLTEREEQVLRMRYYEGMCLHEIGKELGYTTERIRQIEAKALRKIRNNPHNINKIKDVIDDAGVYVENMENI